MPAENKLRKLMFYWMPEVFSEEVVVNSLILGS